MQASVAASSGEVAARQGRDSAPRPVGADPMGQGGWVLGGEERAREGGHGCRAVRRERTRGI
jgi:hypothetical protein